MKPIATLVIALGIVLMAVVALRAQVPPHDPGTICMTPQGWCWAQPPGQAGTPCSCPTAQGWAQGTLQ